MRKPRLHLGRGRANSRISINESLVHLDQREITHLVHNPVSTREQASEPLGQRQGRAAGHLSMNLSSISTRGDTSCGGERASGREGDEQPYVDNSFILLAIYLDRRGHRGATRAEQGVSSRIPINESFVLFEHLSRS